MAHRVQVGIESSQKRADFCLPLPEGEILEAHQTFANSWPGYSLAKQLLLDALDSQRLVLALLLPETRADPDLASHALNVYLVDHCWVRRFNLQVPFREKCFAQDNECDEKDTYDIDKRTCTRSSSVAWSPARTRCLCAFTPAWASTRFKS